jgi:pimeloyl-ACP methyl ester carboxylesterase
MSYSTLDTLAIKHNIRIVHPDRPGIGGSNSVPIEERIPVTLAMIPHLLQHLGIEHVSLAAHSFGTIYALNTLLLYPYLLYHDNPYVAFFAPWVHPDHTGIRHLQAAELLPAGMIGKFSSVARWVNESVLPVVGMSTGLSASVADSLKSLVPLSNAAAVPPLDPSTEGQRRTGNNTPGLDLNDPMVVKELRDLIPTYLFAENIDGVGQDAQLCLRKPRSVPWSTPSRRWEGFDDAVSQLRGMVAEEAQEVRGGRKWVVDAFHAETDDMVGEKGRVSFDRSWFDKETDAREQPGITYRSQTVDGSDHDFILDPQFGASERWLERVAKSFGPRV